MRQPALQRSLRNGHIADRERAREGGGAEGQRGNRRLTLLRPEILPHADADERREDAEPRAQGEDLCGRAVCVVELEVRAFEHIEHAYVGHFDWVWMSDRWGLCARTGEVGCGDGLDADAGAMMSVWGNWICERCVIVADGGLGENGGSEEAQRRGRKQQGVSNRAGGSDYKGLVLGPVEPGIKDTLDRF